METFQIFIKTHESKTITLDVKSDDLIIDIKNKIYDKIGLPINLQRLVYSGKQLDDNNTISFYNILYLVR